MAMHPGGRFLGVLYRRRDDESPGRTLIWDLPARRVAHRLVDPSPRRMADLAFTPDGRNLLNHPLLAELGFDVHAIGKRV